MPQTHGISAALFQQVLITRWVLHAKVFLQLLVLAAGSWLCKFGLGLMLLFSLSL